jgi:hypothetical protein
MTLVPPSLLPSASLGPTLGTAPSARTDSSGQAFQLELEGATGESLASASGGLQGHAQESTGPGEPSGPAAQPSGEVNTTEKSGKAAGISPFGPVLERTSLPAGPAKDVAFALKCSQDAPGSPTSTFAPVPVPWGNASNQEIQNVRAQNIDDYTRRFASLLDARGISYQLRQQYTPASLGNPVSFYDYVFSFKDPNSGAVGSLLVSPYAMDPNHSPEADLQHALSSAAINDRWMADYLQGLFGNTGPLVGMTRQEYEDQSYADAISGSYTYNTKSGPNGLYGTLNPINETGTPSDIVRPPATFGAPPPGESYPGYSDPNAGLHSTYGSAPEEAHAEELRIAAEQAWIMGGRQGSRPLAAGGVDARGGTATPSAAYYAQARASVAANLMPEGSPTGTTAFRDSAPPTNIGLDSLSYQPSYYGGGGGGASESPANSQVAATSYSTPAGGGSGQTTGLNVAASALQSRSVAEPASLSSPPPAGPPTLAASGTPAAIAGRENSAGAGNPSPESSSGERGQSAGPGVFPRNLMDAAPKSYERAANAEGMRGKQGSPLMGSGAGSAGAEKGNIAVAVPTPSPVAQASSNGPASTPAHGGAPESVTAQSPVEALAPGTVQSAGRIDLQIHGQQGERVGVRLVARGSEVQVTVKTASAGLTSDLRGGLQDLVQTLKDSGFHTEAWRPLAPSSSASSTSNNPGAEQDRTTEGGKGGGEQSSGWQQENRGDRGRQDTPPRWVEELEASPTNSPKSNWRELSWRQ